MTSTAAVPAIEMRDVHTRIAGSHILQGVTLTVPAHGVTALLGRNGVGKSTTIKAILGLVPRAGSITLFGEPVGRLATYQIVQRGIGYVPEDRKIFAGLTVAENLRLADQSRRHKGGAGRSSLVSELFPELTRRARQYAGTLSGGQQQMLAIARAIVNDNRLLLVDEPSKGLSPRLVEEMMEGLRRVSGLAPIVLVEQNLSVISDLATGVIVMTEGRVAHCGALADFARQGEVVSRLLGIDVAQELGS